MKWFYLIVGFTNAVLTGGAVGQTYGIDRGMFAFWLIAFAVAVGFLVMAKFDGREDD